MLRTLLLLVFCVFALAVFGQVEISGTVVDKDGSPLSGITISTNNSSKNSITNTKGDFSIYVDSIPSLLMCSSEYYQYLEVDITERKHYLIKLNRIESFNDFVIGEIVVVNAKRTKWQELQEDIPSLTGISIEALQLDNNTFIQPALNRVPGVFMHSGALNTNRITIRGIGNRNLFGTAKIKAYFDEIPLTNGVGETNLEDLDFGTLSSVSVIKGPTSSLYGAGLGGVLHLNTGKAHENGTKLQLNNTFGSYNLQQNTLAFEQTGGSKNKHQIQLRYNRLHSDGYRDNNEYDRQNLFFSGKLQHAGNTLTTLVQHIDLKAFIPSSLNRTDYENEPQKAAFTWGRVMGFEDYRRTLMGLSYEARLSNSFTNTTSLYGTFFDSYESRPFNILEEKSNAIGGRTLFSWDFSKTNLSGTVKLGAELYQENYDWQTYVTNDGEQGNLLSDNLENRQTQNVFAQASLNKRNWTANLGLSFNNVSYDYTDDFNLDSLDFSATYRFEPTFSPYLSLEYQADLQQFYGIVSHGFSPPTLEETLTPDGLINPDIQPETGWNFELGWRGRNRNARLTYQVGLYSMHIRDLLVARRTDFDQFIGINAGKTLHNGLEGQLAYEWYSGPAWTFNAFVNYAYSDYSFKEFLDGESDFSGNELTGTAPHNASAGIRWRKKVDQWYGNINYQFVDTMPLRDDNSLYSENYHLVNAKAGYRFLLAQNKLTLDIFAGINNAFDMKYASMLLINAGSFGGAAPRYYYPGLPRNYYTGVNLSYDF